MSDTSSNSDYELEGDYGEEFPVYEPWIPPLIHQQNIDFYEEEPVEYVPPDPNYQFPSFPQPSLNYQSLANLPPLPVGGNMQEIHDYIQQITDIANPYLQNIPASSMSAPSIPADFWEDHNPNKEIVAEDSYPDEDIPDLEDPNEDPDEEPDLEDPDEEPDLEDPDEDPDEEPDLEDPDENLEEISDTDSDITQTASDESNTSTDSAISVYQDGYNCILDGAIDPVPEYFQEIEQYKDNVTKLVVQNFQSMGHGLESVNKLPTFEKVSRLILIDVNFPMVIFRKLFRKLPKLISIKVVGLKRGALCETIPENIRELDIDISKFRYREMERLFKKNAQPRFPKLERLTIMYGSSLLTLLKDYKRLTHLNFTNIRSLFRVSHLTSFFQGEFNLKKLLLTNIRKVKTDSWMNLFNYQSLDSLEVLSLNQVDGITDDLVQFISNRFPNMEALGINECQIGDTAANYIIRNMNNLKEISLRSSNITDDTVRCLAFSTLIMHLKILDLCNCKQITDEAFKLLNHCTFIELESLFLDNTNITDTGVYEIACSNYTDTLYLLSLRNCPKLTDNAIYYLYPEECCGLKNLIELDIGGNQLRGDYLEYLIRRGKIEILTAEDHLIAVYQNLVHEIRSFA